LARPTKNIKEKQNVEPSEYMQMRKLPWSGLQVRLPECETGRPNDWLRLRRSVQVRSNLQLQEVLACQTLSPRILPKSVPVRLGDARRCIDD
jgi:hypothetical protein